MHLTLAATRECSCSNRTHPLDIFFELDSYHLVLRLFNNNIYCFFYFQNMSAATRATFCLFLDFDCVPYYSIPTTHPTMNLGIFTACFACTSPNLPLGSLFDLSSSISAPLNFPYLSYLDFIVNISLTAYLMILSLCFLTTDAPVQHGTLVSCCSGTFFLSSEGSFYRYAVPVPLFISQLFFSSTVQQQVPTLLLILTFQLAHTQQHFPS